MPDKPKTKRTSPEPVIVANDASHFWVDLPLNTPRGKARVKRRTHVSDFGKIVSACSQALEPSDFIEWQVDYDGPNNAAQTTIPDKLFTNNAGEQKLPAGLSEIIFWAKQFGYLTDADIVGVFDSLRRLSPSDFFSEIEPSREVLPDESRNGFSFQRRNLVFPLFVCNRDRLTIEIAIKEQQKASAIQPMLYLCFPVQQLEFDYPCFVRYPTKKERRFCKWIVQPDDARNCLFAFLLLGMLSVRHRNDIVAILRVLFPESLTSF